MKKTIYDIAKELNLAPSTVSKAISGKKDVSDKTRERILKYIKEVRYFPNANASKLKSKKTYTLGVIFNDDLNIGFEQNFLASILQHFKSFVERRGYEITFVINNLGNVNMSYFEFCQQKGVEGVFVLTSMIDDPGISELTENGIVCVTTDRYYDNCKTIISDNKLGATMATEYFVRNNHKDIGILTGPLSNSSAQERFEGYKSILESYDIPLNEDFVINSRQYSFEYGYKSAEKFLALENKPTAVFVSSDELAFGFIKRLQKEGVKIPEDLEIIGYDDIPFSKHFTPALSTIRQNTKMIGEIAAEELLSMIGNSPDEADLETEYVPVELILRDSTK